MPAPKRTFSEICDAHNIRPVELGGMSLRQICDSKVLKTLCPGWWKKDIGGRILSEFQVKHREVLTNDQIMAEKIARRLRHELRMASMTPEQRAADSLARSERNRLHKEREKEANRLALERVKEL